MVKTIKIIDLLNKIANMEEVPKKIKYRDWLYEFEKDCNDYMCQYDSLLYRENDDVRQFLNDEVKILEEEKKIPEKLISTSLKGIDNLDEKIEIAHIDTISVIDTVNEIIDYLEIKGE